MLEADAEFPVDPAESSQVRIAHLGAKAGNKHGAGRTVSFDIVQLQKESGMTLHKFCSEVGINYVTFRRVKELGVCSKRTFRLVEEYINRDGEPNPDAKPTKPWRRPATPPSVSELTPDESDWWTFISAAKMLGLTPTACLRAIANQE